MADNSDGKKPRNIDQYVTWLSQTFQSDPLEVLRSRYNASTSKAFVDVDGSIVWQSVVARLRDFNDEYQISTGYRLFVTDDAPILVRKPFGSFLSKTFRHDVLDNPLWPDPPVDGWREPTVWLSQVNDILRSMLVVKYLDGVTYLVERLGEVSDEYNIQWHVDYEAKDEGYYAAHFYFRQEVEVPKPNWDTEKIPMSIEVQVTTQLQEVIRRLTHKDYQTRRMHPVKPEVKWQWDYSAPEFVPNYLGHILHYVEGMIMEVRDRQLVEDEPTSWK